MVVEIGGALADRVQVRNPHMVDNRVVFKFDSVKMIAHRLLFFALPALVLLVMQLNIPWHMLIGDNTETYEDTDTSKGHTKKGQDRRKRQKKQSRPTTTLSLEGFKDGTDDDDIDQKTRDPKNGSQRCLVAFDGPSTMTTNEDIDRIPEESERMRNAVRAYQKRCRRQNEWASDLIQKRNMEELALVCEQKRREDKRGEQIYRR